MEALENSLNLFHKRLDNEVPWKIFQDTLAQLDVFRRDYSIEAGNMIGDLKTKMYNGIDTYFMASQYIYEWCSLAIVRLPNYKALLKGKMDETKFQKQRSLMLLLLNDGIDKMKNAQKKLYESSSSFNEAAGKLVSLNYRLDSDFSEKSEYYQKKIYEIRKAAHTTGMSLTVFGIPVVGGKTEKEIIPKIKQKMKELGLFYKDLEKSINKASADIDSTKAKMQEEIEAIGEVKVKAEETKIYVESDVGDGSILQIISVAIDELVANCNAYRQRHRNDALK